MCSWADLNAMIGDTFSEFADKLRYAEQSHDPNRSRWPDHVLSINIRTMPTFSAAP